MKPKIIRPTGRINEISFHNKYSQYCLEIRTYDAPFDRESIYADQYLEGKISQFPASGNLSSNHAVKAKVSPKNRWLLRIHLRSKVDL